MTGPQAAALLLCVAVVVGAIAVSCLTKRK